jgi:hypothetical protein
MSEIIDIKISKDLKAEMAKFGVNWSEYVRESIDEKIKNLRRVKIVVSSSN